MKKILIIIMVIVLSLSLSCSKSNKTANIEKKEVKEVVEIKEEDKEVKKEEVKIEKVSLNTETEKTEKPLKVESKKESVEIPSIYALKKEMRKQLIENKISILAKKEDKKEEDKKKVEVAKTETTKVKRETNTPVVKRVNKPTKRVVKQSNSTNANITTKEVKSYKNIPFKTIRIESKSNLKGYEEVTRQGKVGKIEVITRIRYSNGREVGRTIISEKRVKKPVARVIYYGTAKKIHIISKLGEGNFKTKAEAMAYGWKVLRTRRDKKGHPIYRRFSVTTIMWSDWIGRGYTVFFYKK